MFTLHLGGLKELSNGRLVIGGYDEKAIIAADTKLKGYSDKSKSRTPDGIFWMYINSDIHW